MPLDRRARARGRERSSAARPRAAPCSASASVSMRAARAPCSPPRRPRLPAGAARRCARVRAGRRADRGAPPVAAAPRDLVAPRRRCPRAGSGRCRRSGRGRASCRAAPARMPMRNTASGGIHMQSTNGMPAPPLRVLRLSISRYVAPNMITAAMIGAITACHAPAALRLVAKYRMIAERDEAHDRAGSRCCPSSAPRCRASAARRACSSRTSRNPPMISAAGRRRR